MQLRKLMVPVVAAALSVAACGGDDTSSEGEAPDNGDADETSADDAGDGEQAEDETDDESAEEDSEPSGDGGEVDAAELFSAIAEGFVEAGTMEFEAITTESGQEVSATGSIRIGSDGSYLGMRMSSEVEGVETSMLMVDGQFYIEMTEAMAMPGVEGSWMTFGSEGDSPFGEGMADATEDIGSVADMTAKLEENAELVTVTEEGSATVDGVETTEYHVVVNDIEAYLDTSAPGISEMSYTMWIDGDNRVRRTTEVSDGTPEVDIYYRNYGVDVDISAPPEDEVVDIADMMNQ